MSKDRYNCTWCGQFYWSYYTPKKDINFCCPNHRKKYKDSLFNDIFCKNCGDLIPKQKDRSPKEHNQKVYCDKECQLEDIKLLKEEKREKLREKWRRKDKRRSKNLSDHYVRGLIASSLDISRSNEIITDDLIEQKRIQIMAYRQANDNLKITPELCQNVNLQLMT